MVNYDKIASGLNSHYTEKAKQRMQEKAELKEALISENMTTEEAKEVLARFKKEGEADEGAETEAN